MDKDLYIQRVEEENEALLKKRDELVALVEDITNNIAISNGDISNLDIAFCEWIVPRLKMLLNRNAKEKKIQKDFMLMIDGFSVPLENEKYPGISGEELKKVDKALKLFQKNFMSLWL